MSARKRLSNTAKYSPKPEMVDNESDASDSDDKDNSIINTLPNEVLLIILSKLSHGDLLWTRLVCTKWNDAVFRDPNFLRRTVIRICGNSENGKDRDNILKNSIVKWKHLYLKDLRSFENRRTLPIEVPFDLRSEIETLKISTSKLSWKGFQQILVQFPCLRELKTSHLEILGSKSLKERKKTAPGTSLQYEFEVILNKLTSFQINRCDISTTNLLLTRFHNHLKSLLIFVVKDVYFSPTLLRRYSSEFCQGLFEFLETTAGTLKTLEILIGQTEIVQNFFEKVIGRLNESPSASSSLNLANISIRSCSFSAASHTSTDLEILLQFLKINKNLETIICLPETRSADVIRKFVKVIPKGIVQIEVPGKAYFSAPSFLTSFEELKAIRIHKNVRLNLLRHEGQVMPGVKTFENARIRGLRDIQSVTDVFPNLVHLQLAIANPRMSTNIVHYICEHMKLLVSLDLYFLKRCELTDFSVTGITPSYCSYLKVRGFTGESLKALEIPDSKRPRNPLGSLLRLEKLVIDCERLLITDVGLCFGFRFPHLKNFSLSNRGRQTSITMAGLHYIADYNRSLERIMLQRIVPHVPMGFTNCKIDMFKSRLDRCKDFRMKLAACEDYVVEVASESESSSSDSDSSDSNDSSSSSDDEYTSDDSSLVDIIFQKKQNYNPFEDSGDSGDNDVGE